jgi:hypothetical protein
VAAYIHPVSGGLVLAALLYVGSLGLRARSDRRRAAFYLARHARLAPFVYVLTLATWLAGLTSTWLLRPDLELGASPHLRIGAALVAALTAGWLTSQQMERPAVRAVHPWCGVAALLLAAAQLFFGLQITP